MNLSFPASLVSSAYVNDRAVNSVDRQQYHFACRIMVLSGLPYSGSVKIPYRNKQALPLIGVLFYNAQTFQPNICNIKNKGIISFLREQGYGLTCAEIAQNGCCFRPHVADKALPHADEGGGHKDKRQIEECCEDDIQRRAYSACKKATAQHGLPEAGAKGLFSCGISPFSGFYNLKAGVAGFNAVMQYIS